MNLWEKIASALLASGTKAAAKAAASVLQDAREGIEAAQADVKKLTKQPKTKVEIVGKKET